MTTLLLLSPGVQRPATLGAPRPLRTGLGRTLTTTTTTMMVVVMMVILAMVMTTTGADAKTVDSSGRRRTRSDEGTDSGEWSAWYNSGKPWTGEGDFETTDRIQKTRRICGWEREVSGAQCRVAGTNNTFDSSTPAFLEDHLLQACSSHGLICINAQQRSGACHDYEVRFLCQALQQNDSSDSIFPNLDFKIYILLAAVPLLVIVLRLLWTCWCKPRIKRRRQEQQQRRRGEGGSGRRGGSLESEEGSLSTSSSQASFDSALAHPPPAYCELFGDRPHPATRTPADVFAISGGECAGCGKCLHRQSRLGTGAAPLRSSSSSSPALPSASSTTASSSGRGRQGGLAAVTVAEGERPVAGSPPPPFSPSSPYAASPHPSATVGDDVFLPPPSSSSRDESEARSPPLPGSSGGGSLQGAEVPSSLPPPPSPPQPPCTCSCHRLPPSGHVNLAFSWDSGESGTAVDPSRAEEAGRSPPLSPPAGGLELYPGMHKPVFEFTRIGSSTSFTSFTSLPDYDEALEMLKKNGLFLDEEKV